jgi:hypothetical protein
LLERFGFELHLVDASVTATPEKSRFFEDAQMFRNRRQRHRVRASEMSYALVAPGEVGQDPPPGRVGQGGESAVEGL